MYVYRRIFFLRRSIFLAEKRRKKNIYKKMILRLNPTSFSYKTVSAAPRHRASQRDHFPPFWLPLRCSTVPQSSKQSLAPRLFLHLHRHHFHRHHHHQSGARGSRLAIRNQSFVTNKDKCYKRPPPLVTRPPRTPAAPLPSPPPSTPPSPAAPRIYHC